MFKIGAMMFLFLYYCGAIGFSQGAFALDNYVPSLGIDAPVFDAIGTRLFGSNYVAELYGGATPDTLVSGAGLGVIIPYRLPFTSTHGGQNGYIAYPSAYITIPGIPPGEYGWVQVRAWDTRSGNSYEDAVAHKMGGYGASEVLYLLSGGVGSPPSPAAYLMGLQSFSLLPVPEPSTWFFFSIGLLFLCIKRSRLLRRRVRA